MVALHRRAMDDDPVLCTEYFDLNSRLRKLELTSCILKRIRKK